MTFTLDWAGSFIKSPTPDAQTGVVFNVSPVVYEGGNWGEKCYLFIHANIPRSDFDVMYANKFYAEIKNLSDFTTQLIRYTCLGEYCDMFSQYEPDDYFTIPETETTYLITIYYRNKYPSGEQDVYKIQDPRISFTIKPNAGCAWWSTDNTNVEIVNIGHAAPLKIRIYGYENNVVGNTTTSSPIAVGRINSAFGSVLIPIDIMRNASFSRWVNFIFPFNKLEPLNLKIVVSGPYGTVSIKEVASIGCGQTLTRSYTLDRCETGQCGKQGRYRACNNGVYSRRWGSKYDVAHGCAVCNPYDTVTNPEGGVCETDQNPVTTRYCDKSTGKYISFVQNKCNVSGNSDMVLFNSVPMGAFVKKVKNGHLDEDVLGNTPFYIPMSSIEYDTRYYMERYCNNGVFYKDENAYSKYSNGKPNTSDFSLDYIPLETPGPHNNYSIIHKLTPLQSVDCRRYNPFRVLICVIPSTTPGFITRSELESAFASHPLATNQTYGFGVDILEDCTSWYKNVRDELPDGTSGVLKPMPLRSNLCIIYDQLSPTYSVYGTYKRWGGFTINVAGGGNAVVIDGRMCLDAIGRDGIQLSRADGLKRIIATVSHETIHALGIDSHQMCGEYTNEFIYWLKPLWGVDSYVDRFIREPYSAFAPIAYPSDVHGGDRLFNTHMVEYFTQFIMYRFYNVSRYKTPERIYIQ